MDMFGNKSLYIISKLEYFPSSVEKNTKAHYSVGIRTHDFANLELVSYIMHNNSLLPDVSALAESLSKAKRLCLVET